MSHTTNNGNVISDCLARRAGAEIDRLRPLILAAHQDDETIGASVPLWLFPRAAVVYVTDGAPRETSLRTAFHAESREGYGHIRREETIRALAHVGVPPERIYWLGCIDQEAVNNIPSLVNKLVDILLDLSPDVMITHAYEGGHPDHDAVSLIAHLANAVLEREGRRAPELWEMALYHACNEQLVTGQFISETSSPLVLQLSAHERERKQRMFECYRSQATVLRSFSTETEMLRPAPTYDFSKPPHVGTLWYECLGWSMSGKKWRDLAASALAQFDGNLCR